MRPHARPFVLALAALALIAASTTVAQARPAGVHAGARVGVHHHHHHGHWRGGLWLGVGIGTAWPYYGWGPGHVLVEPVPVVYERVPAVDERPAAPAAADPVFAPRQGQSANQTEYDRQACNRWAMTQPAAVADAQVFHRTSLACMEGRGYSVR